MAQHLQGIRPRARGKGVGSAKYGAVPSLPLAGWMTVDSRCWLVWRQIGGEENDNDHLLLWQLVTGQADTGAWRVCCWANDGGRPLAWQQFVGGSDDRERLLAQQQQQLCYALCKGEVDMAWGHRMVLGCFFLAWQQVRGKADNDARLLTQWWASGGPDDNGARCPFSYSCYRRPSGKYTYSNFDDMSEQKFWNLFEQKKYSTSLWKLYWQ